MALQYIPILEIFLGILGMGLSVLFCTTFCRVCSRIREEHIEMESVRRRDQEVQAHSIYFIPFPRQDSQEVQTPPRYSIAANFGPPPSYTELGFKPDDLPPAYTEFSAPVYPIAPPHTDMVQPQTQ